MGWKVTQNKPQRQTITRAELESAIADAVRAEADCGEFVGVIIERVTPNSLGGCNWILKGVRYGRANRELCSAAVSARVAEKQLHFDIND